MSRLRFVLHALRCSVYQGEPLELPEQEGLADIIEDHLLDAESQEKKS